jgi:hypothetical protein
MATVLVFFCCVPPHWGTVAQGRPPTVEEIRQKIEEVKLGAKELQRAGRDPSRVLALLEQVKPLMDQRKPGEADAVLDRALAVLEEDRVAAATESADRRPVTATRPRASGESVVYEKIDIVGNPAPSGLYDPSVEYDRKGDVGWMAYSARGDPGRDRRAHIDSTFLAKTTDHGRTWTYVKVINRVEDASLVGPKGKRLKGMWKYEVPTLLHDPEDEGREWKLFSHKVFWSEAKGRNLPMYGWIAYRHAPHPTGEWSKERALFGAGPFPPAPYHATEYDINQMSPELSDAVAYTEPGSLIKDGILYLSLTVVRRSGPTRIILLASNDHGSTWHYKGVLLSEKDAADAGYDYFDASSMVDVGGRAFLLASPGNERNAHIGANVYEFDDISTARLKRDREGRPIVHREIVPQESFMSKAGAGQATYHPSNAYGGVILCQHDDRKHPEILRVFNTKVKIGEGADE